VAYATAREPTDLLRLVREVCASVQPAMQQARLRFEARIPGTAPPVRLDRQGIAAALMALLQISIAHTAPAGKVTLWVIVEAGQIKIAVQDTGSGFDTAQELDARSSEMRADGLEESRMAVEAHGGTMATESTPGKGNVCMITIPLDTSGSALRPGMQEGVA
jgi:signal transduction histidine kinase